MPRYSAPTRDTRFIINEMLDLASYGDLPGFEMASPDVTDAVIVKTIDHAFDDGTGLVGFGHISIAGQDCLLRACANHDYIRSPLVRSNRWQMSALIVADTGSPILMR